MIKKVISLLTIFSVVSSFGLVASAETTQGKNSTQQTINAQFTQDESVQLTLSSNDVNFGTVSGLTSNNKDNAVTVTVSSSLPYDVTLKPNSDFTNGSVSIPITKFGLKVDSGSVSNFTGVSDTKKIADKAVATYSNDSKTKSYNLSFTLDKTIGEKSGTYSAPLTLSLIQN